MRKILPLLCIIALSALAGCGKRVGSVPVNADNSIAPAPTSTATAETTDKIDDITETTTVVLNHNPPDEVILKGKDVIEVYDRITVSDFISETNAELINGDDNLITDEIGEHKIDITYIYEGVNYKQPLTYYVKDTTAPLLLNSGSGAVIETGKKFDINNFVGFADNYDSTPELTYSGEVNTAVPGKYPLTATVTDSSGNSTSWELSVSVCDTIPEYVDNNTRLSFESLIQQYAGDNRKFGIDVSKWQGDIDFDAVKAAGCSFVIMRIGTYYDEFAMDSYYLSNMAAAKKAGLDVGIYLYTTANSEADIISNAQWIADQLDGQELDFPIAFDWEDFTNFQQYDMSIHELNSYFELFADEMNKHGYPSMLYSSKNFLNNFWDVPAEYPVWLAHYTDETDYSGDYSIWQMSCFGRIPGIAGDVDFNILYTDKPL